MGLDMYLIAKRVVAYHPDMVARLRELFPEVDSIREVETIIGVWRKAYVIHQWFVDHVQDGHDDCRTHLVEREELEELRALAKDAIDHPERAPEVFPTPFPDAGYNEYYFEELRETVEIIDRALSDRLIEWEFYYSSSW